MEAPGGDPELANVEMADRRSEAAAVIGMGMGQEDGVALLLERSPDLG